MGFLDKVKEQAAVATAAAKDAAQKGQAKIDDLQSKRAGDALLRDLGAATYAKSSGRATEATDSEIARLTAALSEHEATHGPITLDVTPAADGTTNGSTAPPPTGAPVSPTETAAPAGPPPSGQTL
jgi:hypothetical protein